MRRALFSVLSVFAMSSTAASAQGVLPALPGTWSAANARSSQSPMWVSSWDITVSEGLLTIRSAAPADANARETRCRIDGSDTTFTTTGRTTITSTYRCKFDQRTIEARGSFTIPLANGQSQRYEVQQKFELTKEGTLRVSDHVFAGLAVGPLDLVDSKETFSKAPGTTAPRAAASSNRHLLEGMASYAAGDYRTAIPMLDTALVELKGAPGFEGSTAWRVLVDNLGMAYGLRGDLQNAKATFDYGVSKDPTYPMFHYNLACTFAEMPDRDGAIAELKEAFKFKSNVNPGEPMPNPATDDSFKRFLGDKTFLAALDDIQKAGRMFPDRLDFSVAGAPWALTLPAEGFQLSQNKQSPDGKQAYFLFSNGKTGITASIYIEPAVKCTDSPSCRDFVRSSQLTQFKDAENVSSSEIGTTSVFEYFLPAVQGVPVRQHNMFAEFVQDGFWVDLHVSKAVYNPSDRPLFEALVDSVRFEKKP